ncbi:MAG: hypothetical protein HKO71_03760 [Pseudomonadales bacterium]|nr:hypothetical protein [Gammaproteobacteria bacterium]NNL56843.1 hypothetical protein [Pseudomonadales bacterium]
MMYKQYPATGLQRLLLLALPCFTMQGAAALDIRTCFAHAQTYYETLYCEIRAENSGATLPDFWDFKKNNEVMQALLLKKPARQLYIDVPKPVARTIKARSATRLAAPTAIDSKQRSPGSTGHDSCFKQGQQLQCGEQRYNALGNIANAKLDQSIWQDSFKLQLQPFRGNHQTDAEVLAYLRQGYSEYLQHMVAIGLAGETFSFTKFAFFFDDHHAKGVDFAKRMQKMFYYLKQDKKNIAVNTAVNFPDRIDSRNCARFADLLACAGQRSNYLFRPARN